MEIKYKTAGDTSIVIEYENKISEEINSKVRSMYLAIEQNLVPGVEEVIPTYRSLLINYNPLEIKEAGLIEQLTSIASHLEEIAIPEPQVIEIPTCYGGDFGPDLKFVAEHNKLSMEEVVKIHSQEKYLIYLLGFTPGFPYLGGMSGKIATPRLDNPRTLIPAGSVGIVEFQTGIYPIASPGGWRLIGRTPLKLFNPAHDPYFLLQAGDYLKFVAIEEDEYHRIKEEVERDEYKVGELN